MTDDELNAQLAKIHPMAVANPHGWANAVTIALEKSGLTILDLAPMQVQRGQHSTYDRVAAAEDAMTLSWSSLTAIAASKGYHTVRDIAAVLGEQTVLIRELKRTGYVPKKLMMRMAAAPDNPVAATPNTRSKVAALMDSHHGRPERYGWFSDAAMDRLSRGDGGHVSYIDIMGELRRQKMGFDDKLALLYAKTFEVDHPEYQGRMTQRHGGQQRHWETDWSPALAREVIQTYLAWVASHDLPEVIIPSPKPSRRKDRGDSI